MLTNAEIGELLALEGEKAKHPIQRALRKASRAAHLWREEASGLWQGGRSLTELAGIGPFMEKLIGKWMENPPVLGPPDELRRGFLTWTEAHAILAKSKPAKILGDLQMHTEWSDGSGTVQTMAQAGFERGHQFIAITDHAQKLKIAGGINEVELEEQGREIAAVNEEFRKRGAAFRALRSIELNLAVDGAGDMSAKALDGLDVVLGAFHSALRRTDDQTERYLAALRNPSLNILGHPRGRIYNFRLGLKADWARVFSVAAELDKAIEIDCYPDRQDVDVELLKLARKVGVRISLGTDAHHPEQLEFIDFGLAAAAVAGIAPERIINTMTADKLIAWAKKSRG